MKTSSRFPMKCLPRLPLAATLALLVRRISENAP
jgi:hypothetical protein